MCCIPSRGPQAPPLVLDPELPLRLYKFLFLGAGISEGWLFSGLPCSHNTPRDLHVHSVFFPDSGKLGAKPDIKAPAYNYERTGS